MKVLWFANKPLPPVTRRLGLPEMYEGGWLNGLEQGLRSDSSVRLAIASPSPIHFEPFEDNGVLFYHIGLGEPTSGAARVLTRWQEILAPHDDLTDCLAVVDHFQPDLVHIHGTERAYGLMCDRISVPSVISIQGLLTVCERMDVRGIDASLVQSLSPSLFLRGDGLLLARLRIKRAAKRERHIISICRNFVGRTRFDADVLRALNPTCRYFDCDEIVRPEFRSQAWSPATASESTVYCTAGQYMRKGLGTLLEAIAILRRQNIPGLEVRISGTLGSPEEDERAAHHRIKRLGLQTTVTLLGRLGPSEIASELRSSRVFVLPSHADNSPNALAEAMTLGVPCVATSAGGIPSMAKDGIEALLVQDGDPYALAGALLRIISDASLAARLGRRAKETAQVRHDPERITARLLDIYRSVASDGG